MRWSMPRIHAGRSHPLAGHVAGGEHHGGGAVGDRRAVVLAQRGDRYVARPAARRPARCPCSWACGLSERRLAAAGRDLGHVAASVALPASSSARAWSAARLTESGHSGADVVRVELAGEHLGQVAGRRLAVAVDERGVDVAELELHPRLVQRPGAVHLDVDSPGSAATAPTPSSVDHEGERRAGEVVGGARAGEADVVDVMSTAAEHLVR